jgi:methionyl-tRNA formyltransferase
MPTIQNPLKTIESDHENAPTVPQIRIVFMGTPQFAASILDELVQSGYNVVGVVTKPDRSVGRSHELSESDVKLSAKNHGLPTIQPENIDAKAIQNIVDWKPDLIIVAAYGKILPESLLLIPGFGCINVHASLLPKWRGASPIQNALLAGETHTGVTIMLMDAGMDTGDILAQQPVVIDQQDTRETLFLKLTTVGIGLLLETLPSWIQRDIKPTTQDNSQATLCQLIERNDGRIIWTDNAKSIYDRYRALHPWPGIFTFFRRNETLFRLKLLRISYQQLSPQTHYPVGQVVMIGEKIGVQTGAGIVFLEEVQLEGKGRVSIDDFLRGNSDLIGNILL